MDQRDSEQIDAFLGQVGKGSLFEYYELAPDVPADDVEQAIKRRRNWAQGQQANPKFRDEAIWLIRNNALVRRVMVDERDDYLTEVNKRRHQRELEKLTTFVRGVLLSGVLSPEGERAIRAQGAELGLPDEAVSARIDEILVETGARRAESAAAPLEEFFDYYELLHLTPDATLDEIKANHREEVRKARNMRDKAKASALYERLDQAWVYLSSEDRRAEYDRRWRTRNAGTEPPPEQLGYLPPPEGVQPIAAASPPPVQTPPPPRPPPTQAPTPPSAPVQSQPIPSTDSDPPPPARPPRPPPDIKSTIPINPTARSSPRKPPRLTITSPDVVQLKVGRKPAGHSFLVRNSGQGRMPGRVTSDRDWLVVMRPRLDADAHQQEIQLVIDPTKMPRSKGSANVTVVTDHGDRRSITFEVERSALPVPLIAAGVAGILVLILIVAALLGVFSSPASSATGTLEILTDPGSDEILVDGKAVGSGARVVLRQGFPADSAFKVTARLDGFAPAEKTVEVPAGAEQTVRLELQLTDLIDRQPPADARYVEFKPDGDLPSLARRQDAMKACMRRIKDQPGLRAQLLVDLYFNASGRLDYVNFHDGNFDQNEEVTLCLRRQLRAVTYPTIEGGNYGLIQDYKIEATVTNGSG